MAQYLFHLMFYCFQIGFRIENDEEKEEDDEEFEVEEEDDFMKSDSDEEFNTSFSNKNPQEPGKQINRNTDQPGVGGGGQSDQENTNQLVQVPQQHIQHPLGGTQAHYTGIQVRESPPAQTKLRLERDDLADKVSSTEQREGHQLNLIQTQLSEPQQSEERLKDDIVNIEKENQCLPSDLTKASKEDQLEKTLLELEMKHKLSLEQAAGNYSKLSHEKATVDQKLLEVQKRCSELESQAGQAKVMEQQMRQVNTSNVQMRLDIQKQRTEINDLASNSCKSQLEQNNKYMRDYSIQNGELQKKNSELTTLVKAHESESLRLKSQIDSMSKQASQQADYGSLKSHIDSLTKVLAETKQESITFRKDVDAKNKEISKQKNEIEKLNREVNKAREDLDRAQAESPKVKKRPEDPDRLTLSRELQSVKKDLEAARRANVKLEKELAEKERAEAREMTKV